MEDFSFFLSWSVTLCTHSLGTGTARVDIEVNRPPSCFRGNLVRADFITYSLYLLLYYTYNSFTLPFQGRTLNIHAAEANLHRFPLPQAPGWGTI